MRWGALGELHTEEGQNLTYLEQNPSGWEEVYWRLEASHCVFAVRTRRPVLGHFLLPGLPEEPTLAPQSLLP